MQERPQPGLPRRIGLILAIVPVLAVGVADLTIAVRTTHSAPRAAGRSSARGESVQAAGLPPAAAARAAALDDLLSRRATAVLNHDLPAYLATDDPDQPRFRAADARRFAALTAVPLASWAYTMDTSIALPPSAAAHRYDAPTFAPLRFALKYQLRGFDDQPTTLDQFPTFVQRAGHWYVGSFDDYSRSLGDTSAVDIWDFGPVRVVRNSRVLVLGHPQSLTLMKQIAGEAAAAIPRVTAVWGPHWQQKVVVLVPGSERELGALVADTGSLSQIAAVASAEVKDCPGKPNPTGDRVGINPRNWPKLSPLGRRVVLTHELTHVATRAATGACTPTWLVEGFADYVGYLGSGVPVPFVAEELSHDVRGGRVPRELPSTAQFSGSSRSLAQAYEGGWLACRMIASQWSQRTLVDFYAAVGTSTLPPAAALAQALEAYLHLTPAAFIHRWQQFLRSQLA